MVPMARNKVPTEVLIESCNRKCRQSQNQLPDDKILHPILHLNLHLPPDSDPRLQSMLSKNLADFPFCFRLIA